MGIYKTYKEAVLANGGTKGVYTDSVWFYTNRSESELYGVHKCNPADHLETVADFLARGKKLIKNDLITYLNGSVNFVENAKIMNASIDDNHGKRFILQAAADQSEKTGEKEDLDVVIDTTPQQIESPGKPEWKHGDDVIVNGKHLKFACLDPFDKVLAICCSDDEQDPPRFFHVNSLQKPETPAEREERERLEAAYHLYCKCGIQHDTVSFEKFKAGDGCYPCVWLDIVNETGYRKKEGK